MLTFGFETIVYNVSESTGSVDLGIFFISGNAGEFVPHVNVSTIDGTATGKYCTSNGYAFALYNTLHSNIQAVVVKQTMCLLWSSQSLLHLLIEFRISLLE